MLQNCGAYVVDQVTGRRFASQEKYEKFVKGSSAHRFGEGNWR